MTSVKSKVEKPLSFNLTKISKWQLDYDNSNVELPALQRSFVWKANQIESLWDSILRGFPIGSFLLSRSEDEKLFLLDGQQRATSIALGFYNPWNKMENNFWSLKNNPIVWIDLLPNEKTNTQKFVLRVVTQSHPWGYQRKENNKVLSVSDRRNALKEFKRIDGNKEKKYIEFDLRKAYPYDSNMPVPLSFLLESILNPNKNWKDSLIKLCKENLSENIKTKHLDNNEKKFIAQLSDALHSSQFDDDIFGDIKNIEQLEIPAIIVKQEILKAEDELSGEDPTLFVRLNSSGTRIAGEELIYSIYKASFPEAKNLVENIGASFVTPSLVISLVSRLAWSEINESYPYPISVNEFRKRIKDENFKNKLRELIGTESSNSLANLFFHKAFDILLYKNDFEIPPVLVKSIVKGSPDLFLMLLQWIKLHEGETNIEVKKKILATLTALTWFGKDNAKYVRELWSNIGTKEFWNKENLSIPYLNKYDSIMYPMISPSTLREYLLQSVVKENIHWEVLYPNSESEVMKTYRNILDFTEKQDEEKEAEIENAIKAMWDSFINKLFWCKPLVLFAQRKYINESFGEFNQMETLEDTNTPWDWDHIYPDSWVYYKRNISQQTKHWNRSIGNFRAMSLEENRSENNSLSPCIRLNNFDARKQSFIEENDWEYWSKINRRINEGDDEMITHHLNAIVHRLCNIYKDWYETLNVGALFNVENKNSND